MAPTEIRQGGRRAGKIADANRRLSNAIDAVKALHRPVEVYEYDDMNGVFKTDQDGEQIVIAALCKECTGDDVLEAIGDCEYDPDADYYSEVRWPCPTRAALDAALTEKDTQC